VPIIKNTGGKRNQVRSRKQPSGVYREHLVIRLVELGAPVTVIDSLPPGRGNREEVESVSGAVQIKLAAIRNVESFAADVVFNVAGALSDSGSMGWLLRNLELAAYAQLAFLSTRVIAFLAF